VRVAEAAVRSLDRPPAGGPVFAAEHLDAIIVHRDRRLLDALREDQLRPLAAAAPGSREALRQTLRSWLVHMGNRRLVAEELQVHPQTVRYRMGRLHELFGPVLDDPAARLRLLLALGWEPGPEAPVSGLDGAVPPTGATAARRARR
jgi:DNA-binding PucR family transcriptional regulator